MDAAFFLLLVILTAIIGVLAACSFTMRILRASAGTPSMINHGTIIRKGIRLLLKRAAHIIAIFVVLIAGLLFFFIDNRGMPWAALSYVLGALSSLLASGAGASILGHASPRVLEAAKRSEGKAFRIAYLASTILGLSATSLSLLGFTALLSLFTITLKIPLESTLTLLLSFCFGTSCTSLFLHLGLSAEERVSEGNEKIAERQRRVSERMIHAETGRGSDLFAGSTEAILAALIIGQSAIRTESSIFFPLLIAAFGILSSVIASFLVYLGRKSNIVNALKRGIVLCSFLLVAGAYILAYRFFPVGMASDLYIAFLAGLAAAILLRLFTEYYTVRSYPPTEHLAAETRGGISSTILGGMALGSISTVLSIFTIILCAGIAHSAGGFYGVAIAALGALSIMGSALAMDSISSATEGTASIAETSRIPEPIRQKIDALKKAGRVASAIGGGYAVCVTALVSFALFFAYVESMRLPAIDLREPTILIGIFLGGMLPFLFFAMITGMISRRAHTFGSQMEMLPAALLALFSSPLVGFVLGSHAVASFLIGNLIVGIPLCIALINGGNAWQSARLSVEESSGKKKATAEDAVEAADSVGSVFRNAVGPSILSLIRLLMIVSLLTAGFYSSTGIIA